MYDPKPFQRTLSRRDRELYLMIGWFAFTFEAIETTEKMNSGKQIGSPENLVRYCERKSMAHEMSEESLSFWVELSTTFWAETSTR